MLVNDTMMEHPVHLHGMFAGLDNGQGEFRPRKHTPNVRRPSAWRCCSPPTSRADLAWVLGVRARF